MNKRERETEQLALAEEKKILKKLEKQYAAAQKDILNKTKILQADIDMLEAAGASDDKTLSMVRSKVYQKQHQEAIASQIGSIVDKLHSDQYSTIQEYLNDSYTSAYVGTMYSVQSQGVPLIVPIDQAAAVKAIQLDSKVSKGLYSSLGVDAKKLKKTIASEVTRGVASSLSYNDIARNISNVSKAPLSRAKTIARTEVHRIRCQASMDAALEAKKRGCDIVKQWDSTLDKRTRDSHARVDGEIKELEAKFSNGLMFPGDPAGRASEVINCRCIALTRAKWALDESELEELKKRAEYFGLDKTADFEDYKKKYLDIVNEPKYTILEKLKYSGKVTPEIENSLENSLSKMPEAHRRIAESKISGIEITDSETGSGYDPKTRMIYYTTSSEDPMNIVHEYAHGLEAALDIYNDPEFIKVMKKGLESVTVDDVIYDEDTFTKPIYRIKNKKFVSTYQGRLYEEYGIYSGEEISLDGMREYFSEGYTEYIRNPQNLKKHDPDLFNYFEGIK